MSTPQIHECPACHTRFDVVVIPHGAAPPPPRQAPAGALQEDQDYVLVSMPTDSEKGYAMVKLLWPVAVWVMANWRPGEHVLVRDYRDEFVAATGRADITPMAFGRTMRVLGVETAGGKDRRYRFPEQKPADLPPVPEKWQHVYLGYLSEQPAADEPSSAPAVEPSSDPADEQPPAPAADPAASTTDPDGEEREDEEREDDPVNHQAFVDSIGQHLMAAAADMLGVEHPTEEPTRDDEAAPEEPEVVDAREAAREAYTGPEAERILADLAVPGYGDDGEPERILADPDPGDGQVGPEAERILADPDLPPTSMAEALDTIAEDIAPAVDAMPAGPVHDAAADALARYRALAADDESALPVVRFVR